MEGGAGEGGWEGGDSSGGGVAAEIERRRWWWRGARRKRESSAGGAMPAAAVNGWQTEPRVREESYKRLHMEPDAGRSGRFPGWV